MYPPYKVKSDSHPVSVISRLRRRVRMILERYWPDRWLSRMMLRGVDSAIKTDIIVNERLQRFSSKCPFSEVDFFTLLSSEDRRVLQRVADTFLQHQFDLLGSGPVNVGEKIEWHTDFVTGFRWDSSQIYSLVRRLTPEGSDIKRPWELSRCQHFVPLGLSWLLSGQEKYLEEYVAETEDWIAQNPVGFGVNWVCPMDAAIRAVNWLAGYALFCSGLSSSNHQEFRKNLTVSLWEHARFIETHLEWNGPLSERRANHFLSDIVGLFTLGVFFSDTDAGRRWLEFSHKWLEKEIRRQVLDDGVHFECSISYHRLCLEMFIWCYHLGMRNDIYFSDVYKIRMDRMRAFVSAYTRPNGMAPLFGDNDDGRLLYSGLGNINDHRYLWDGVQTGASATDAAFLSGNDRSSMAPASGLSAFTEAGFYVVKHQDMHLIVRAGRHAHLGAHAHCDQLSFELCIKSCPVFVDPGSFVYTSDPHKRNLYRGTRAHNVLSVNGADQNRASGEVFGFLDDTQTRILRADQNKIEARHTGFKTLTRSNFIHSRTFRFSETERMLEIYDEVDGLQNGDLVEWFFHLSPGLDAECRGQNILIENRGDLICRMIFPREMTVQQEFFHHSPSYGCLQEAKTFIFSMKVGIACAPCKARYLILWKV